MGILNNFKDKISKSLEETVHQVDWDEEARKKAEAEEAGYEYDETAYDEPVDEEPEFEKERIKLSDFNPFGKIEKKPKAPKPPKAPKQPKAEKPPKEPKVPKVQPAPVAEVATEDSAESDSPEEKKISASHILGWFKREKSDDADDTTTEAERERNSQAVQDILEFLQIQESYEIPPHILLVEDLDGIGEFDLQMPKGYDMGQVRTFVEQTKDTVRHLQGIIEERNDDIAKLATTVDRLQVDLHNSKFETEVASGINILPTEESELISNENIQLKVQIRELEQKLQQYEDNSESYEWSEDDQHRVESLQDELSVAQRQYEESEAENRELRARLAQLEEELDDPQRIADHNPNDDRVFVDIHDIQYEDSFAEGLENHAALPSLDDPLEDDETEDQALPSFDFDELDDGDDGYEQSDGLNEIPYHNNPNFTYVDEPLEDVVGHMPAGSSQWGTIDNDEEMPSLEPETPEEAHIAELLYDDDEDDILDKLIRERQGGTE